LLTWRAWLKLVRSLSPSDQIKLFALVGCVLSIFGFSLLLAYENPTTISGETLDQTTAWVSSNAEAWRLDRKLYKFNVRYKTSTTHTREVELYAESLYYDAAKLRVGSCLIVDLIKTPQGIIIQRAIAENGIFIYDQLLRKRVAQTRNLETSLAIFWLGGLGVISLVTACVLRCKL
jgi:uncharacterized protein YneR